MYTKGNWKYTQAGHNHWIHGPNGEAIAYIGGQDGVFTSVRNVPHKANARLIAAAPDLLEACRYTIERLKAVKHKTFPIMPILEAIAKAEGR